MILLVLGLAIACEIVGVLGVTWTGVGKALLCELRILSYVLPAAVGEGSAPTLVLSSIACGRSMGRLCSL